FEVIGLDLNDKLVAALNQGMAPVEEPQLQEFIDKARPRLRATHSYDEAVKGSDVTFIIVPTPSGGDQMFSNKFVVSAVRLIGEADKQTGDTLENIYKRSCDNSPTIRRMSFVNAELTKISVNTYVTTKISYANMLAEMCDKLPGADVDVVSTAIGSDTRVGAK